MLYYLLVRAANVAAMPAKRATRWRPLAPGAALDQRAGGRRVGASCWWRGLNFVTSAIASLGTPIPAFTVPMARYGPVLACVILSSAMASAIADLRAEEAALPTCGGKDQCVSGGLSSAFGKFDAGGDLAGECCAACARDASCEGWQVRHAAGTCELMDTFGTPAGSGGGCTSQRLRTIPPVPPAPPVSVAPAGAKNVLLLVSDDMRPSLGGAYGLNESYTPNLDRLGDTGLTFRRAYVNYAYCAPSRNSFMTGRRPDATQAWSFNDHFREQGIGAQWASLPEWFRLNGYTTSGAGKLFHPNLPPNYDSGNASSPRSWSPEWLPYQNGANKPKNKCKEKCCGVSKGNQQWYCMWDLEEGSFLLDQDATRIAVDQLRKGATDYKETGKPFFVGLGTHRPHLPWDFPKEFMANIPQNVSLAPVDAFPANTPHLAFHDCAEMSGAYWDTSGNGTPPKSAAWQQEMRRAYYATISYVDSLLGQVLDELEALGVANDTVVVHTGDHGWQLQEHSMWCKMSNFETGTRVPLFIRAPWKTASTGATTMSLAELVDLYPTLAELAGIPLPTGELGEDLGGQSLAPLLDDPTSSVKDVALSQFARCWQNNTGHDPNQYGGPGDETNHTVSWESMSDCHWVARGSIDYMGYAIRTEQYRFTQWFAWDGDKLAPKWDSLVGTELYDHTQDRGTAADIGLWENRNLANDPDRAGTVSQLAALLKKTVQRWNPRA